MLADAFAQGVPSVGASALDDRQGDAVDEQHDVGPPGLGARVALDHEFVTDVEDVVLGVIPVDVAHRVAAGVPVDGLLEAFAKGQ